MAELEVRRELQSLDHGDVAIGLEHHHGDRATGEGISDDELCDNAGDTRSAFRSDCSQEDAMDLLQADLLVRDGLNDANRNGVHESCPKENASQHCAHAMNQQGQTYQ